jgi:hypothetical protein
MSILKRVIVLSSFLLLTLGFLPSHANAAPVTVAGFEMSGFLGNEATINATNNNTDLETVIVSRGAGITPAALANALSSNNFVVAGNKASATTTNEYYEVALQPKNGMKLSLERIQLNVRRSATGRMLINGNIVLMDSPLLVSISEPKGRI